MLTPNQVDVIASLCDKKRPEKTFEQTNFNPLNPKQLKAFHTFLDSRSRLFHESLVSMPCVTNWGANAIIRVYMETDIALSYMVIIISQHGKLQFRIFNN